MPYLSYFPCKVFITGDLFSSVKSDKEQVSDGPSNVKMEMFLARTSIVDKNGQRRNTGSLHCVEMTSFRRMDVSAHDIS